MENYKKTKIALTGASSFTGLWIAKALSGAGFEVHALFGSSEESYTGLTLKRVQELKKTTPHLFFNIRAEENSMNEWILEHKPEFWIHHHHYMKDYRRPDYDVAMAKKVGLEPLSYLMENLKNSGARGVVFSGSYFEPGEGGNPTDIKVTPYSASKKWVWEEIQNQCKRVELPLSKVVIPNPIGPFENFDRLIPIFIQKTIKAEGLIVPFPDAIQDHLPAQWLGVVYVKAIQNLELGIVKNYRPSGRLAKNLDWLPEIQNELIVKRLKLPLIPIQFGKPKSDAIFPPNYSNNKSETIENDWASFWDGYLKYFKALNEAQ